MKIYLPNETMQIWLDGDQNAFTWRFYKHFGWFPDRSNSSINSDHKQWWLETEEEYTNEKIQEVYTYCENPEVFEMLTGEILQIDIDWQDMMVKINNYIQNNNITDLVVTYIGHGAKQFIHFSRFLTFEEKIALKNLISRYINFL